jgi:hypothetical protein
VSITTELWANPPSSAAMVSSGGTDAPSAGTSESWTMAGGYASMPSASNSTVPATQFHIIDPAQPTEIMVVTNVSGTAWTVTRGAESTTPVTHASGFTVQQVASAYGLKNLLQVPQSGNGVALPNGTITSVQSAVNTTATLTVASLAVPAGEATPNSVYELEAWGGYGTASSNTTLTWTLLWGSTQLTQQAFTMPASVSTTAPARWRFKASIAILTGPLAGVDARMEYASTNAAGTAVSVYLLGANPGVGTSITTSSAETLSLTAAWTTNSASNGLYVTGTKVWKAA